MKIAFLTNYFDGTNINKTPKGIGYYIVNSLKNQGVEVELIHPTTNGKFIHKVKQVCYNCLTNKLYFRHLEEDLLKEEAAFRSELLKKSDADFVFSFGPLASAFLETDKKIAYWTDTTIWGFIGYFEEFDKVTKKSLENGIKFEKKCIEEKASAIFLTSQWAKNVAIKQLPNSANKFYFAPFGANLEINHDINFIEKLVEKRINSNVCKLLLIGGKWKYKGGNIALAIVNRLNEMGFAAELTVIGCKPDKNIKLPNYVKIIEFLNKNNAQELDLFLSYFQNSEFFIMPTLNECAPHAIIEANAFGLPAISHKTGGVSSIVTNGLNGQLFEIGENIDNFCNYIIENFNNKEKYKQLCFNSYSEYKSRLNWNFGAKIVIETMKNLL